VIQYKSVQDGGVDVRDGHAVLHSSGLTEEQASAALPHDDRHAEVFSP
jgi:hypothetical protein